MAALIGVKYLWRSCLQGLLEYPTAEICIHTVRQTPADHLTAIEIRYCHQRFPAGLHKSSRHRDIGKVCCPYLAHLFNLQVPKQIWIDFMALHRQLVLGFGPIACIPMSW